MALLLSVITALNFICIAFAYDARPLQDLCVADKSATAVKINGYPCKDINDVTVLDFLFPGIHKPGTNPGTTLFKTVDITTFPGLNTIGLSLLRFDLLEINSSVTPHSHPRSSEVIYVVQGSIEAGFVSNQKQYNINLTRGDVFVFPLGLVHYFRNTGKCSPTQGRTIVMGVFNSQLPGFVVVPQTIYGV